MDDSVTWNYDNPVYDQQKGRWYYEGRRPDGSRVRKYPPVGDSQTTHQETRSTYQLTPRNDASALAAGMQAMSIQPVGSYDGDAQHYTTVQPGGYSPATSSQAHTWSEHRPSVYATAGATTTTESGTGVQQSGPDVYSHSPGTSTKDTRADTLHHDSQAHGNYATGLSSGSSYQHYEEVKRDPVSSYPSPSTSSSVNPLYGALGGNEMQYNDGYGAQPSATMDSAYADTRSSDRSRKHKHSSKGKGKVRADMDPYGDASAGKPMAYNVPTPSSGSTAQGDYYSNYPSYDSAPGQPYRTSAYPGQSDYGGHAPGQESRYGTSPISTSSSAPRNFGNLAVEATVGSTERDFESYTRGLYEQGGGGGDSSTGYRGSVYQATAEGAQAPSKSHSKKSDVTSGMQTNAEYLDGRYQVQPSMKFEPGNVFKVMWSEPKGGTIPGGGSRFSDTLLQDHMSGVWTGFRRFIVIRNGEGHCNCVPILTYGKLGCLKNGVKPHHHGIVYEKGSQPIRLPKEPDLRFRPICMEMNPGEHISEESRVNYSKLVTVEHNVKVLFVGNVLYEDWPIVQQAVDECWDSKKTHRSEHSGHRSGHRKKR
ncbi:hypothetical protein KVR01_010686 [Diaporthe batatas]|uniref:uncharacterized protein n=1 Tax=Diaporthe batatas TaxID=748121 RepID=UPI001D05A728|nr:uncharacterized protein KVR01_010686 [Diaporthe batatas]KAG8160049.1 hypothetical protein KVR01_010686 [Diaporthe batatas]